MLKKIDYNYLNLHLFCTVLAQENKIYKEEHLKLSLEKE